MNDIECSSLIQSENENDESGKFCTAKKGLNTGFLFCAYMPPGVCFQSPIINFIIYMTTRGATKAVTDVELLALFEMGLFWDYCILMFRRQGQLFFSTLKKWSTVAVCVSLIFGARRDRFSLRSYKQINYCCWLNIKLWKSLKDIWLPSWPHFFWFRTTIH